MNVGGERTLVGRRWEARASDGQRAREDDERRGGSRESGNQVIRESGNRVINYQITRLPDPPMFTGFGDPGRASLFRRTVAAR